MQKHALCMHVMNMYACTYGTYVHYIHTYSIHTYIIAQRSVELLFVCPLAMPIGKFPELVDGTQRHSIVVVLVVAHAHTHKLRMQNAYVCTSAPPSQPTDLMKLVSITKNNLRHYENNET